MYAPEIIRQLWVILQRSASFELLGMSVRRFVAEIRVKTFMLKKIVATP